MNLRECWRHSLDPAHGLGVVDPLATAGALKIPKVLNHVSLPLEAAGPLSSHCPDLGASARRTGRHAERSHLLNHHSAFLEETRCLIIEYTGRHSTVAETCHNSHDSL